MPPDRTSRAARLTAAIRGVLLACVGTVIALLIAEGALRLFRLAPVGGVATVTASEYERLPGMLSPNQHVVDIQNPALPYRVTIDSLGFRGPNFPRNKPPNQMRVLMIGDSFVYGDFVDDEKTFPAQLEARLRAACHDDVRVINAGLGGTTVVDEAQMLQRTLPLDPDLVVLVYVENDIEDLAAPTSAWERFSQNRMQKSRFPLSLIYPVARNMALWNLLLQVTGTRRLQQERAVLHPSAASDSAVQLHLRDRYGEALTAFRDTLAAHRVPFVFVMYPSWLELDSAWEKLTWMAGFAAAHQIDGVNLLPALQATHLPAAKLYLVPKDGHPSPTGYSIAADSLVKNLLHGPLAPRACKTS